MRRPRELPLSRTFLTTAICGPHLVFTLYRCKYRDGLSACITGIVGPQNVWERHGEYYKTTETTATEICWPLDLSSTTRSLLEGFIYFQCFAFLLPARQHCNKQPYSQAADQPGCGAPSDHMGVCVTPAAGHSAMKVKVRKIIRPIPESLIPTFRRNFSLWSCRSI